MKKNDNNTYGRRHFLSIVGRSLLAMVLASVPALFLWRKQITQKQVTGCPNHEMCKGCNAFEYCELQPAQDYRHISQK